MKLILKRQKQTYALRSSHAFGIKNICNHFTWIQSFSSLVPEKGDSEAKVNVIFKTNILVVSWLVLFPKRFTLAKNLQKQDLQ